MTSSIVTSLGPRVREVADGYIDAMVAFCEGLAVFPGRGRLRDDIRPGLHTISYRKRTVVAYAMCWKKSKICPVPELRRRWVMVRPAVRGRAISWRRNQASTRGAERLAPG